MWIVSLPTMFSIDTLLNIWLKNVPAHTASFSILVIAYSLVNALDDPIWTLALSVGKLKWYIIIGSSIFLMSFPISYIFLRMGYEPEYVFVVNACVRAVYIMIVLNIIRHYVPISRRRYLKTVIIPISIVVILSGGICFAFNSVLPEFMLRWVVVVAFSFFVAITSIWVLGLQGNERSFFKKMIREKVLKRDDII